MLATSSDLLALGILCRKRRRGCNRQHAVAILGTDQAKNGWPAASLIGFDSHGQQSWTVVHWACLVSDDSVATATCAALVLVHACGERQQSLNVDRKRSVRATVLAVLYRDNLRSSLFHHYVLHRDNMRSSLFHHYCQPNDCLGCVRPLSCSAIRCNRTPHTVTIDHLSQSAFSSWRGCCS
jgi:hypothetical protein